MKLFLAALFFLLLGMPTLSRAEPYGDPEFDDEYEAEVIPVSRPPIRKPFRKRGGATRDVLADYEDDTVTGLDMHPKTAEDMEREKEKITPKQKANLESMSSKLDEMLRAFEEGEG